jgi:hypothetical protein
LGDFSPQGLRDLARRRLKHRQATCTVERDYDAFARWDMMDPIRRALLVIALVDRLEKCATGLADHTCDYQGTIDDAMTTPLDIKGPHDE